MTNIKGRVREYLEEEHGLKFQLVLQQGQHSEHLGELSQALVATEDRLSKKDREEWQKETGKQPELELQWQQHRQQDDESRRSGSSVVFLGF